MHRALIACAALLRSAPGQDAPAAMLDRALAPVASFRAPFTVSVDGSELGRGVALVDGSDGHFALRNPLGQPYAVLRVRGDQASLELVGDAELVAPVGGLARALGLAPDALLRLLNGRPTTGARCARDGAGWSCRDGALVQRLDARAALVEARLGGLVVTSVPHGVDVRGDAAAVAWRWGDREPFDPPASAFSSPVGRVTRLRVDRALAAWSSGSEVP